MLWIIIYTISILCFYLIFFRIKYRTSEKVYLDEDSDRYYRNYEYRWIDKGKVKFPLWIWFVGLIVLLTPVLNIMVYLFLTAYTVCGGFEESEIQFVLGENFKKFLNKRY